MNRHRRPRTALLAGTLLFLQSATVSIAFQSPQVPLLTSSCRTDHHPSLRKTTQTSLDAKKKSSSGGGGGGFGSGAATKKKSSSKGAIDATKVRSVSGYTGSGTKVLATAANNFDRIRKLFGKTATTDVYVRSPLNDESVFWFVGKVIRMITDEDAQEEGGGGNNNNDTPSENELVGTVYPTEVEAILSQKRLILEYAKNQLRPQNMAGPYSSALELWSAPGDSEMDVVQNKVTLVKVDGSSRDLRDGFNVKDVGYNPEIYVGEEKEKGGLRVVRDGEGRPVKPAFDI
jgi:hypothetical protein